MRHQKGPKGEDQILMSDKAPKTKGVISMSDFPPKPPRDPKPLDTITTNDQPFQDEAKRPEGQKRSIYEEREDK